MVQSGVNFANAVGICLRKYAHAAGRASRAEYWYFFLFSLIGQITAGIVDLHFGLTLPGTSAVDFVSTLLAVALFLPTVAVSIRRLHDVDRSGWWTLILIIPFAGFAVLLYWLCRRGTAGDNRFGPDPLVT